MEIINKNLPYTTAVCILSVNLDSKRLKMGQFFKSARDILYRIYNSQPWSRTYNIFITCLCYR